MDTTRNAGEQSPAFRVVVVDGMTIRIDESKLYSWRGYQIVKKLRGVEEITPDSFDVMLEYIAFVTDADENAIVEHLGGDDAQVVDVITLAAHIINELKIKNLSGSQTLSDETQTNCEPTCSDTTVSI